MSTCCASLPAASCCDSPDSHPGGPTNAKLWFRLGLATLVSAQTMAFGLAVNLSPPDNSARLWIHGILAGSVLLVFFLVGLPVVRESWRLLLERRIGLEHMFLLGITGAFFASVHSTLSGQGAIFYEVVAILLAIYTFGSLLRQRHQQAAIQTAEALRREFEFCNHLLPGRGIVRIHVREVHPSMRLQVLAGEGIPVDGIIESGTAYINETPLTGEPFPVIRRQGDRVFAGCKSIDRSLVIIAESQGEHRRLDLLLRSVGQALETPSSLQREADRIISWFLPTVLFASLLTFMGWTIHSGWITGMFNALAVLVVACPCAMGLATPIGIWSAINTLARQGLVIHSGDFIERLACVDTVVFDKTGTLSEEELTVSDFNCVAGINRAEIQGSLAAIQRESNHPVARAFHSWITTETENCRVEKIDLLPGIGVAATLATANGKAERIEIGNEEMLSLEEQTRLAGLLPSPESETPGTRRFYIKRNSQPVAVVCLRETLRSTVFQSIDQLEKFGLKIEIMTGDSAEGTAALGLGRIPCHAGLLPTDKITLLQKLSAAGRKVLFVGDGINDSGAMSQAHVSVALASGAPLPNEIAQARLFGNNLGTLCDSILFSRQVLAGIRRNLHLALAYNLLGIGLAAAGVIHPVLAALLMLSSSSLVTWRALRFAEKLRVNQDQPGPVSIAELPSKQTFFPWVSLLFSCGVALQGPLLSYMGALSIGPSVLLSLLTILPACFIFRGFPRWNDSPTLQFVVGMLALGNLGMLLGWSAHAGFGAVIRDGVCLCGCPKSVLGRGVLGFNWMQLGMLLTSIPVLFLANPLSSSPFSFRRGIFFLGHAAACLMGMLLGMEFSAWVMSLLPQLIIQAQTQFFLTFSAMTCGMILGMTAACRLYLQWLKRI